jgi:hypothetical protein
LTPPQYILSMETMNEKLRTKQIAAETALIKKDNPMLL